jgi:hypothetical protein
MSTPSARKTKATLDRAKLVIVKAARARGSNGAAICGAAFNDAPNAPSHRAAWPAARAAPVAQFAITMRRHGEVKTTDIPLPSAAIEVLALEAMSRDLDIAGLVGQVLVAAINKDMIHKILAEETSQAWSGPQRRGVSAGCTTK